MVTAEDAKRRAEVVLADGRRATLVFMPNGNTVKTRAKVRFGESGAWLTVDPDTLRLAEAVR